MLGYKIYFNGEKFVADNTATEVQTMPCDSKGICDLMLYWNTIKPEFQNKINEAYERKSKNIKNDVDELQFLLRVAENFKE